MQPVGKQRPRGQAPQTRAGVVTSRKAVFAEVPGQYGYVDHPLPWYQVIRDAAGRPRLLSDSLAS